MAYPSKPIAHENVFKKKKKKKQETDGKNANTTDIGGNEFPTKNINLAVLHALLYFIIWNPFTIIFEYAMFSSQEG